jgi:hypothetical protein
MILGVNAPRAKTLAFIIPALFPGIICTWRSPGWRGC